MEQEYANALMRVGRYVEDMAKEKTFAVFAYPTQIGSGRSGSDSVRILELQGTPKFSLHFMADTPEEAAQLARAAYGPIIAYMNNRFLYCLARLAKFLATDEARTLVVWQTK